MLKSKAIYRVDDGHLINLTIKTLEHTGKFWGNWGYEFEHPITRKKQTEKLRKKN